MSKVVFQSQLPREDSSFCFETFFSQNTQRPRGSSSSGSHWRCPRGSLPASLSLCLHGSRWLALGRALPWGRACEVHAKVRGSSSPRLECSFSPGKQAPLCKGRLRALVLLSRLPARKKAGGKRGEGDGGPVGVVVISSRTLVALGPPPGRWQDLLEAEQVPRPHSGADRLSGAPARATKARTCVCGAAEPAVGTRSWGAGAPHLRTLLGGRYLIRGFRVGGFKAVAAPISPCPACVPAGLLSPCFALTLALFPFALLSLHMPLALAQTSAPPPQPLPGSCPLLPCFGNVLAAACPSWNPGQPRALTHSRQRVCAMVCWAVPHGAFSHLCNIRYLRVASSL